MAAQLYTDINRRGAASVFRKEGRNLLGMAEWENGVSGIVRQDEYRLSKQFDGFSPLDRALLCSPATSSPVGAWLALLALVA